jgi:uncharacterized membrane protein YfcA
MLIKVRKGENVLNEINIYYALIIGAFLGFFSGLIGIGGGIILSPILIMLGWATVKQTAAVSAVFILVNSIAGLSGFILKNEMPEIQVMYMVVAGLLGGLLGSWLGSFRIGENYLRYTLSVVLLMASIKLFLF